MFRLKIITIEKVVVDEKVDELVVTTSEGQTGILSNHIPLLSVVRPGLIRYRSKDKEIRLVSTSGSIEVNNNVVSVLVDEALPIEAVDIDKARAEQERLLNVLKSPQLSLIELRAARQELTNVRARLQVKKP